jgi:hypothetical protein
MATITSTPDILDIVIYKGDTLSVTITVKDAAGTAINLTGWSVKATIFNLAGSPVNDGWVCGTPTSGGQITMFLTDGESEALATGFTYDLEIWRDTTIAGVDGTVRSNVITLVAGKFTVTPDITDGAGGARGGLS